MKEHGLTLRGVANIFGGIHLKDTLVSLEKKRLIPPLRRIKRKGFYQKGWYYGDIPQIGEQLGIFQRFSSPVAICVFTTKGGVLKSSLSLNIARVASLHNIKSCVVGLDIQGDITTALGFDCALEEKGNLSDILSRLDQTKGLADFFTGETLLEDIVHSTDLPSLFLIPETPELVALNDSLNNINRREFWLKEKVIDHLKQHFDLIIMDCSPNWNKLTTNALVACDVLVSPLECKINNFRNLRVFRRFLDEFKKDMHLNFGTIFVPTKYSGNRKLTLEIKEWYHSHLDQCTRSGIRESVAGEEAIALYKSVIEHIPCRKEASEIRELLTEIWHRTTESLKGDTMTQNNPNLFTPKKEFEKPIY